MAGRPRTVSDQAVFDAVSAVVAEVGPSGLTLSAVAENVGVSAPALAQRFGSKRNLLVAYAAASAQGLEGLFEEARRALANNLAFLHLDLTDVELGAHAAKQSRELRRRIADLIREAQEGGDLGTVDPVILADTLYTTYNGALVTWAIDGRGTLRRWLSERLDRVLAPYLPDAE